MVGLEYKYKASSTDNAPIPTMRTLSSASQNHIFSLLDAGYTAGHIAASTYHNIGTVSNLHSKYHPHLSKSLGGHPPKLSPANIGHAQRLISSGKADTAVDVARTLRNVTNQSLCAQMVCNSLKAADMKAVVDLCEEQKAWLERHEVEVAFFTGQYAYALGDYRKAEACFGVVWEKGHPSRIKAIAGHLLGVIWARRARGKEKSLLDRAERVMRESLQLGTRLQIPHHVAQVLNSLGGVLAAGGDKSKLAVAEGYYRQSLQTLRRLGDAHGGLGADEPRLLVARALGDRGAEARVAAEALLGRGARLLRADRA